MGDMTWKSLLSENASGAYEQILPWYGAKEVHSEDRTWTIQDGLPPEHGWHLFRCRYNRYCHWLQEATIPVEWRAKPGPCGYLVGGRFIGVRAKAETDPEKLVEQTEVVYLAPDHLEWLSACRVYRDRAGNLLYLRQELLPMVAYEVIAAFVAKTDIGSVKGVTPALELAFNWWSRERERREERRRQIQLERERKKKEEDFLTEWGSAQERREAAAANFELAAADALRVSGASLIGTRGSVNPSEIVVQYRIRDRNFECVVDRSTLRIIDAGVCLTDEATGEKGDTWLTLESLPGVVCEAMDTDKLVVWRHL